MQRTKKFTLLFGILTLAFSSFSSYAGHWIEEGQDWYYMTDDGNYAKDTWLWLDENHDGKAEFYHFEKSGVMSRSKSITMENTGLTGDVTFNIDKNGVTSSFNMRGRDFYKEREITPIDMPPYSIHLNNGKYEYSLNDGKTHYDFSLITSAYTDHLVDCGNYYSSNVRLIIDDEGSMPGAFEIQECYIPATAYFSKDCSCRYYTEYGETYIPISEFLANDNYYASVIVESTNSDGYITSCFLTAWD